jgi:hypothetical protein
MRQRPYGNSYGPHGGVKVAPKSEQCGATGAQRPSITVSLSLESGDANGELIVQLLNAAEAPAQKELVGR